MALFTKCIFKPRSPEDGFRISVMSRHTLNDGETPDVRITPDSYDAHHVVLAPSPQLLGDYYKRGLIWNEFEKRFRAEIAHPEALNLLRMIAELAHTQNITLLCKEEGPELCHRRILAEECNRLSPSLVVVPH